MAKDPYDGGGPGSSEKELEDAFWASMAAPTSTTAPPQGGRASAGNIGPGYGATQQTTSGSSSIWSFPNIYSLPPMTPISQFLMADVPSTPLPYADTWTTPNTMNAPTYTSSFSNTEQSRLMSYTQCLQEGLNISATLSSYSDILDMSRPSTGSRTYMSAASTTYMSPSASSPLELKQEPEEEPAFLSTTTTTRSIGRFSPSTYAELMQEMTRPRPAAPQLAGVNVYPSPVNVDQGVSSTSSSESDAVHARAEQLVNQEEAKASSAGGAMEAHQEEEKARGAAGSAADAHEMESPSLDPSTDKGAPSDTTKKQTSEKAKKKGQKRHREPRVALVTKSEVEHLEDGFRWRKYGQKAVKNSPYPRSYYRCTNSKCSVKKRVERSPQDASMVITTYEGQHNHHSPAVLRGSAESHVYAAAAAAAASFNMGPFAASGAPSSLSNPPPPPFSFSLPRSSYELAMQLQSPLLPSSLLSSSPLSSLPPSLLPSSLFPTPSPAFTPNPIPNPSPTFANPNRPPYATLPYPHNPAFGSPSAFNINPSSDPFSPPPALPSPSSNPNLNPPSNPTSEQDPQQPRGSALFDALEDLLFPPKPH
ncbi:hypothetical protein L7F22_018646 [Adiantum nelumboides]|nr:hypothetical protein [Adiantum nelumboides]